MTEKHLSTTPTDPVSGPESQVSPEEILVKYRNNRWDYELSRDLVLDLYHDMRSALIAVLMSIVESLMEQVDGRLSPSDESTMAAMVCLRDELAAGIEDLEWIATDTILTLVFSEHHRRTYEAAVKMRENFLSIAKSLNNAAGPVCIIDEDGLEETLVNAAESAWPPPSHSDVNDTIEKQRSFIKGTSQNFADTREAAVNSIKAVLGMAERGFDVISYDQAQILEKEIIYILLANLCLRPTTASPEADASQNGFTFDANPFGVMDAVVYGSDANDETD